MVFVGDDFTDFRLLMLCINENDFEQQLPQGRELKKILNTIQIKYCSTLKSKEQFVHLMEAHVTILNPQCLTFIRL
jgi:hypothetical protein